MSSDNPSNEDTTGSPEPRPTSTIANVALFVASSLIALAFAEIVVRVFVPVREVGKRFAVYDPYYGKVLKKSFSAERKMAGGTYTLTTNSLGFRGPEPTKPFSDTILFLGDSFTMGHGVTDGREYPAVVRAALRTRLGDAAPEVVNAGIGNTGTGRWIRFLRRDAEAYHPKIVVLQYCQNDPVDNLREQLFTLSASGELVEATGPVKEDSMRRLQGYIEQVPGVASSHLFNLALEAILADHTWTDTAKGQVLTDPTKHPLYAYARDLTTKLVDRSLALAKENGWSTVLLIPVEGVIADQLEQLRAAAAAHGTPVIEIPSRTERPEIYFQGDGHWNERGHAEAAAHLLEQPVFEQLGGTAVARP